MRNKRTIGAIAECLTCGKEWENYSDAAKKARQHARNTGHHVSLEITTWHEYNAPTGKQEAPHEPTR